MAKTSNGKLDGTKLTQAILDSSRNIWLAGLGAFSTAEGEGAKIFDTLVKAGEKTEARTRKVTEQAFANIKSQAGGTWDRLEQVFEDRVAGTLGRLGVPSKKEVDALSKRVASLTTSVDKLAGRKVGTTRTTRARPAH
jgi:poly(hydroxyalkanoate) granule-associated protein